MSKRQVSRLRGEIDERGNAFLARPPEGAWPCLWLDATYLQVREGGRIVSPAVIVAVAVDEDGKRQVLGIATGPSEAETFWSAFLRSLADRGLRGGKLVIAPFQQIWRSQIACRAKDDHKGRRAAARRMFNATHQRCRVGLLNKVPPSDSIPLRLGWDGGWDAGATVSRAAGILPLRVAARPCSRRSCAGPGRPCAGCVVAA